MLDALTKLRGGATSKAEELLSATLTVKGRQSKIMMGDGLLSVTCPGKDVGTQYAVLNDQNTNVTLQFLNMPTDCIDVPTGVPCAAMPSLTKKNVVPPMFYCVFQGSDGFAFEGPYYAERVKESMSGKLAAMLTCELPLENAANLGITKLAEITASAPGIVNVSVMHGVNPDFLELPFVGYPGGNTLTVP
jgi:hypothetical protein